MTSEVSSSGMASSSVTLVAVLVGRARSVEAMFAVVYVYDIKSCVSSRQENQLKGPNEGLLTTQKDGAPLALDDGTRGK